MGCGPSSIAPADGATHTADRNEHDITAGSMSDAHNQHTAAITKFSQTASQKSLRQTGLKTQHQKQQNQGNDVTTNERGITSSQVSLKSAILIQKWYRSYKARLEARRRAAWVVYQNIEYSSEASQLHLHNFFNDILNLGTQPEQTETEEESPSKRFTDRLRQNGDEDERELMTQTTYQDIEVEKGYSGPRLSFPLSATHVQLMIDSFRQGEALHVRYLLQLLHETRLVLKTKPNIYLASSSISKQVTVIGDLHGQLDDLLLVFYKNGLPDITNPYVFNGDFVDRGPKSIETAAVLFACLLVWPTAVFVNRGNHEDHVMNCRYGFIKEIQTKYRHQASRVVSLFADLFAWLPLATVIDDRVLVAHGGVSNKLDLELVRKLQRQKYGSALRPPAGNPGQPIDYLEWRQVLDLLWSDPKPQPGCRPNTFRGGGCYFGPDVTEDFLKRHHLEMVVRSHECKSDGFEYCHNGTVLTVFSASNYYAEGSNRGAYVKFTSSGEVRTMQFMTSKATTVGKQLAHVEERALHGLRVKIAASKSELVEAFKMLDKGNNSSLTVAQWACAMEDTLKLDLPWRILRPHLVQLRKDGSVLYMTIFERVEIQHRLGCGKSDATSSMTETVYKNKEELETIFRIMDRDSSGCISQNEFQECCRILCQATKRQITDEEAAEMAKLIDLNSDGSIDFNEFLEAFRIVDFQQHQNHLQLVGIDKID